MLMDDEKGITPLMFAALYGEQRIVHLLLNAGADPNRRSENEFFHISCALLYFTVLDRAWVFIVMFVNVFVYRLL